MARRPRVVVVGLGPAGPELTTAGAAAALASLDHVFLRTTRHPAAEPFLDHPSFDAHYETLPDFDAVYAAIVEDLVAAAATHGEVGYALPGSPDVLERTVALLRADERIDVETVPGMSFLDLAWGRLGVDPVEAGVRLVDGHRFAIDGADVTGSFLIAHCHANHVLSDIKLAYGEDTPERAVVLQRVGLPDEHVVEVAWADLDRAVDADHLTSVFVPAAAPAPAAELVRFHELVRRLRAECPWDRAQTHGSLAKYAIEEVYEVVDAIAGFDPETGDGVDALEEELGDLLFQVVFHAVIAAERGDFDLADVARGIHDKLHRRHPHVFGDVDVDGGAEVVANWEQIKRDEKGRTSILDGIPSGLPALQLADKVLSKAARIDAPTDAEHPDDPAGRIGAAALDLARRARTDGVDPEGALRAAVARVQQAVRAAETGRAGRPAPEAPSPDAGSPSGQNDR